MPAAFEVVGRPLVYLSGGPASWTEKLIGHVGLNKKDDIILTEFPKSWDEVSWTCLNHFGGSNFWWQMAALFGADQPYPGPLLGIFGLVSQALRGRICTTYCTTLHHKPDQTKAKNNRMKDSHVHVMHKSQRQTPPQRMQVSCGAALRRQSH